MPSDQFDFDFPPARGGRKPAKPLPWFEVVRELTLEDLALRDQRSPVSSATDPERLVPPSASGKPPALIRGQLRASHHQLAQLVARGADGSEIQLITGYSVSYISNIKHDPAFRELVAYYGAEGHDLYIDALTVMRDAGVSAAEELRGRLRAEAPTNDFTKRELVEVIETTIVKPMNAVANARRGVDPRPDSGSQTNVNIRFVQAQPQTIIMEHNSEP